MIANHERNAISVNFLVCSSSMVSISARMLFIFLSLTGSCKPPDSLSGWLWLGSPPASVSSRSQNVPVVLKESVHIRRLSRGGLLKWWTGSRWPGAERSGDSELGDTGDGGSSSSRTCTKSRPWRFGFAYCGVVGTGESSASDPAVVTISSELSTNSYDSSIKVCASNSRKCLRNVTQIAPLNLPLEQAVHDTLSHRNKGTMGHVQAQAQDHPR